MSGWIWVRDDGPQSVGVRLEKCADCIGRVVYCCEGAQVQPDREPCGEDSGG